MGFIVFVAGMILLFGIRGLVSPKKKRKGKTTKSKNKKQPSRKRPARAAR